MPIRELIQEMTIVRSKTESAYLALKTLTLALEDALDRGETQVELNRIYNEIKCITLNLRSAVEE